LNLFHVNQLVADTLIEAETLSSKDSIECLSEMHLLSRQFVLSELLFNKTQCNPFFLSQMFKTLYQEKLLIFDFIEGRWLWDIEQIQAIGITDYNAIRFS